MRLIVKLAVKDFFVRRGLEPVFTNLCNSVTCLPQPLGDEWRQGAVDEKFHRATKGQFPLAHRSGRLLLPSNISSNRELTTCRKPSDGPPTSGSTTRSTAG
jgi:hypothetical protein